MSIKYSTYLDINPAFESVVDIDADKRNKNLWREYIVGEDMEKLMEYLCLSLGNEAPDSRRSFWINGSYGTGKSYAGIFVKHLIEEKPEIVEDYLAKSSRLSKFKNRFAKCRKNGDYLVIWKTGCTGIRTGDMMLIEAEKAIHDALIEKFGDSADLGSGSLLDSILEKLNDPTINWDFMLQTTTLGDDYSSLEELKNNVETGSLSAIQAVAAVLRQKKMGLVNNLETFQNWVAEVIDANHLDKSGIFFIWDEFTEYVAYSDDHTVMQQISEFCKVQPFFTFFIVHKSTDLVARLGGENQYQLIIHRFHEVEFHLTADASLDLIAGSITTIFGMEEHWKEARKQVISNIRPFLGDMIIGVDDRMVEMIGRLCPMHPMTIRLLSRVAENYAAAERTMFRFMKDRTNENIGFVGYISKYGPDDQACWLTSDWLWDYFFTRESDFHDKDTKVAEYIHHYEENKHLVESNENALRVFKTIMLLLAVMSSAKGLYSGRRTHGGISATVECLNLCLSGVMSNEQVNDLLATLVDCKLVVIDKAVNGVERLQLPFKNDGGSFQINYEANEKKYTRYQMFSKDGVFAKEFEKKAWETTDPTFRRMKICVCCAETNSIKTRLEEINKELDKYPYKLGLLIVTVSSELQYMSIQGDLQERAIQANDPRLTIALVKNPLTEETRKEWIKTITKREMANEKDLSGSAGQATKEGELIISNWVLPAVNGSKIIAWNGTNVFNNQYGMPQLRKTIQISVLDSLFPYAPENFVETNTAFRPCNDSAPLAGIQRTTNNSQLKSVLAGLGDLKSITNIDEMTQVTGGKVAESISKLAKLVRDEMISGHKVVLADFWEQLKHPPFGYYDTIACGVLLGYVFSCYKDSAYSWTDSSQGTHVLGETTLKKLILDMVKGRMSTDYLSSGSQTFQLFRQYMKAIMNLSDAQIANETECWHSMRDSITKTGAPFWTLKYLPDTSFGNSNNKKTAVEIIDEIQSFIVQDYDREGIMSNINQLFVGHGKIKGLLSKTFQDKQKMNLAFRSYLFSVSSELQQISMKLNIQPEALNDKLHQVMQGAIYTWTESQVNDKLSDVVSEYRFLETLNVALGKANQSLENARNDLGKLFRVVRIPKAAVETLNKQWYSALEIMYAIVFSNNHMTQDERTQAAAELREYGKAAIDFLKDGKSVLSDLIEAKGYECTNSELDSIYAGLKDLNVDTSLLQFEKELNRQITNISHARNRILLKEQWRTISGEDTVKDWCSKHGAPLLWIVTKEERKAIETVICVLKEKRTIDQNVVNAQTVLKSMDSAFLSDDKRIVDALLNTVGSEYRDIFIVERDQILAKAKMKIGNDMSTWEVDDLRVFQKILKEAQQAKAKREKLSSTKDYVQTMNERKLRDLVKTFLDAHPEFCEDFSK